MYALVDCNNFFVSCERVFRPDTWQKPVAVLSNNDGCFISRSEEAKAVGLPMGAPVFKYKQLIKQHNVVLFSANFELYGNMSERIVELLREETPLIEVYSIDECFLDISQLSIASYQKWSERVRARIYQEVGIPVSIGVAPTKTLAKVASTFAKKHGGVYVVVDDEHRENLLGQLAVEDIWGIGRRIAPKLYDQGISRASQLAHASDEWIRKQFNITGVKMVDELRGIARLEFGDKHEVRKSIMRSRTFGHTVREYYQLESAVATFAAQAAVRLRRQSCVASRIIVFLSTGKHALQQKRASTVVMLGEATDDTAKYIVAALKGLGDIYDPEFAYYKAGVILLDIVTKSQWQLSLIDGEPRRDERAELMRSVDTINKKYGNVTYFAHERLPKNARWHSRRTLRSPRYTTQFSELPTINCSL